MTINGIPIARIDGITPNSSNEGDLVLFHGNYTDFENNITEFYWESNKSGFLSSEKNFSISNLLNGTHKITFRVKDNYGVWSENVTEIIQVNGIPRAYIDNIIPSPSISGETVWFYGNGTDDNEIESYEWSSNIDNYLSSQKSFNTVNLSNGTHEITFKVKDNNDVWGVPVITTHTINGIPQGRIKLISENPSNKNDIVYFSGDFTDFEDNITDFYWESGIDGILSDQIEFSTSDLSNGTHEIRFKVKDNAGSWSELANQILTINGLPYAKIESIIPNPVIETEEVDFLGSYIDYEDNIIQYYWESNIDGFLSNKISFSLSNLSIGNHTITFRIKDNFGEWSENDTTILHVNKMIIPRIEINEIKISNDIAIENQEISIRTKIKNIGTIPVSNYTVKFYYDDIEIESIKFENVIYPGEEKSITIPWIAVKGNHTLKIRVYNSDGVLLDSKIKTKEIEVLKEGSDGDDDNEGWWIIFILIIIFIILLLLILLINRWYAAFEEKAED